MDKLDMSEIEKLKEENKQLKEKIAELESELKDELSKCPKCGSRRWGRPFINDERDWERRECSNCDYIYSNP